MEVKEVKEVKTVLSNLNKGYNYQITKQNDTWTMAKTPKIFDDKLLIVYSWFT